MALAILQATIDPSINVRRHAVSELSVRGTHPGVAAVLQQLAASEADPAIVRYGHRAGQTPP